MKILISGCSFSSGWGVCESWPAIMSQNTGYQVYNIAKTSSSNNDIFLKTCKHLSKENYDLVFVQFTALNRITVSPSPINESIVISHYNTFLQDAITGYSKASINNFIKIFTLLNQDWKHYFDLVSMIDFFQQQKNIFFINGLLPWVNFFFDKDLKIPLTKPNIFLESLLQIKEFNDMTLQSLLERVLDSRDMIDMARWVNLNESWNQSKIDVVSAYDSHPGQKSQYKFAGQVIEFIKNLPKAQ